MSSVSNRHRPGRAGVVSLETALVLVPFFWLLLATIDLARYFFTVESMLEALNQAGRIAIIGATGGDVSSAWNSAPFLNQALGDISATLQPPSLPGPGSRWVVSINYTFTALTPGLGALSGPLTLTTSLYY